MNNTISRASRFGLSSIVGLVVVLAPWMLASARAATVEAPPDPGYEVAVVASDVIAEVEILAGGTFRAVGLIKKILKGEAPKVIELEGFNSFNWDTVHHSMFVGTRIYMFLSKTERPDVFVPLTPATPRFIVTPEGVMTAFGDPPVRFPVKAAAFEQGLSLLIEKNASGKTPATSGKYLRGLWDQGEIEARYLAVEMAGSFRDDEALPILLDASKDKLLKLRLRAIEALGKVGSQNAFGALRSLLKDEKKSVAREAARVLARRRDADSIPALLEWVRKNVAATARATTAGSGTPDSEQVKAEIAAFDVLALARSGGMFGDTAKISRALLEIARMANEKIAAEAIDSSMAIAPNESIPTLIEIAQDRLSDQRDHAFSALKRIALKPVRDIDEFQTWWKSARSKLSEDARREAAEAAARALPHAEGYEDRRKLTTTLRTMPGGIGIVTCAPFLANSKTESMFGEDDLVEWNSTLALPFIIERLSLDGSTTRKSALDALIAVCARSPRLATICWPLIRAQLADRDSGIRRSAETASGLFSRADGIDALLDGISGRGNYEPSDSGKVLYSISARTFGFSINEPHSDQVDARRHLRGWWSGERKNFKPLAVATPSNPFAIYPGEAGKLHVLESLDDAARAVKLEAQTVATDSEISESAFNVLLNERGADDAFWKKLIAQNRSRDRARGLLGSIGSTVLDTELTKRLVAKSDSEIPLTRALIVVSLGASNDAKSAGAKALVAWLKSNAVAANDPLKRLGVLSLAMANNETESLKYLNDLVDAGLKADPPDADTQKLDDANSPYTLLRSAIVALSAREDGNAALLRLLNDSPEARIRETAARALSLRRDRSAIPGIVKALDKADRYTWMDYTYILEPLLNADDSVTLREMLDSSNKFMRAASVWLLTRQLDFGNDPQTKAKVISALNDEYNLVRYYAAEALGMRKSKAALEGLVKLLDDLDDDVKAVAAQALGELGDKEACMLASKAAALIYRIDVRWMKALAVSGDKKWLAEILKLATSNMYVEQRAGLEALSASDAADAKERILKTYHSDDETFQTVAFDLLTERGDVSLALIKDDVTAKDKSTRARALHFLIRLGSPGAKAALKDALKAEDDPGLKAMIEWGIVRGH